VHRKSLLDVLARYRAQHPDEAPTVDRMRALVELRPDCFERSCLPGHVTGSAFVLSPDGRRTLLVLHRKLGRWLQPGGHADGESDLARVAVREAEEETGLSGFLLLGAAAGEPFPFDLDVHAIPAHRDEPPHEHHDVRFLLGAPTWGRPAASDESRAVAWFDLDELPALGADPSLLRMADKLRTRRGRS
jgi:8-oxo-dGTP pyrophosphatase MutT (NUDIX family)